MPQPPILAIGEALVDIVAEPGRERVEHIGGSPTNVAIGLARLDHSVRLATVIGDDARGARISTHLRDHRVRLTSGSVTAATTSTALVTVDDDRNATYEFDVHWALAPVEVPDGTGHIHTGSLAAVLSPGRARALEAVRTGREHCTISYDPNVRPGVMGDVEQIREQVEAIVPLCDVVKASSDDAALLYPGRPVEDVIDHWLALGPSLVVLTQGAAGVAYRTRSGEFTTAPTRAGRVIDTVGAGDSFMAGLISGLISLGLLGGPTARQSLSTATNAAVRPAIDRGLACSAVTVGHAGAYAPSLDEL